MKTIKSTFDKDVAQEKILSNRLYGILFTEYLDKKRKTKSKFITFEDNPDMQFRGVDIEIPLKTNPMYIDMKCQMNKYINNPTDTYCIELSYLKNGDFRLGWFLDKGKITTHYLFVWIHKANVPKNGTVRRKRQLKQVEFMIVSKRDIMNFFYGKRLGKKKLMQVQSEMRKKSEKSRVENGVKFVCSTQLSEKPVNAILSKKQYENMPHTQHYWYENGKIKRLTKK